MSIHPGYLAQANFVWPRFYANPLCAAGTPVFLDAVTTWSRALAPNSIPTRDSSALKTRLFIGLDGSGAGGLLAGLAGLLGQVKGLLGEGFGGICVVVPSGPSSIGGLLGLVLGLVKGVLRELLG